MATVAAIAAVVSALGGAYGAISAAQTADYNAQVAEQQAKAEKSKAEFDATMHRQKVARLASQQLSGFAKSGVATDEEGSPQQAFLDTAWQGKLDEMVIRYGGDINALRANQQAKGIRMQGRGMLYGGLLKSAGTLISGFAPKTTTPSYTSEMEAYDRY